MFESVTKKCLDLWQFFLDLWQKPANSLHLSDHWQVHGNLLLTAAWHLPANKFFKMSVLMIYLRMERRGRERLDKSRGAHILEDFATNQLVWYYCHYWHYWHNWCYEIIHIMTNKVLFKANTKFVASLLTFLVLIVNSLQLHHTYKWMSALGSAMTALHWQPWRLDAALGRIGWVELAAGGWSGSNLVTGTGRVGCCTTQVVTNGEVKESFQHLRKFPPNQVDCHVGGPGSKLQCNFLCTS